MLKYIPEVADDRWIIRYGHRVLRRSDGYVRVFLDHKEAQKAADRLHRLEARYPMLAAIPERFDA